jgi:hypothetical protein
MIRHIDWDIFNDIPPNIFNYYLYGLTTQEPWIFFNTAVRTLILTTAVNPIVCLLHSVIIWLVTTYIGGCVGNEYSLL